MKRVKYIGATDAQVRWLGHDDPRKHLRLGGIYEVEFEKVHPDHTAYYLYLLPGKHFYSVCFEEVTDDVAAPYKAFEVVGTFNIVASIEASTGEEAEQFLLRTITHA